MRYPDKTTGLPGSSPEEYYAYNALGQTKVKTDRNGNTHAYLFDVVGRLVTDATTTLATGVDGAVR